MNPATRAAVAGVRRHPRRTVLTGLAVLVATVFAAGAVLASATTGAALAGEDSGAADALLAGLSVFVGIAMVAAAVVVGSTFRIVLARRGRELALLRCVGASRAQVTRSVLAEAAVTGLVAGVLGTALAIGLGEAGLALLRVSGTEAPPLQIPPGKLAVCVGIAVLVTVVSAVGPARSAGRVPPVVALGEADATEARAPRRGRRAALAGALAAVAAVLAGFGVAAAGSVFTSVGLLALSGLVLFGALVAVGPMLVAGAARLVAPLVARSGAARLAVGNARRVSRRTAATTTVLALGTGLTAALLVGMQGLGDGARAGIDQSYPADAVVLSTGSEQSLSEQQGTARSLAARLDPLPELRARAGGSSGTEVLVDTVPGTDPQAAHDALARAAGPDTVVLWSAEQRAATEQAFAAVRAIGLGLVGITLVVAVVGVGVTLALSVTERTREIALLRALGLTRSAARRSVAWEAGLAGAVGAVAGVVLGTVYGVLTLVGMQMAGHVAPPAGQLAGLGAGVVAVAVLASAASMRSAGRVEPAQGLVAA
ncbi:FtsX-like permease family protein [Pseudonocardia phyllosphaerae]|uniref:FtsX-like permease family protein n=1 Tax=Pseudonocardia phyllosphaerae TaxID=3390502 RepID=UPI00397D3F6B